MANLLQAMKSELNNAKTLTENGAVAYATSGNPLLDFNYNLAKFRSAPKNDIQKSFKTLYFFDPILAVKDAFYLGDIRGGAGERNVFRSCLLWLADSKPEICKKLIPLVAEYNRFDSLLPLLDTQVAKDVTNYLYHTIVKDMRDMTEGKPISLCAKWMPSVNASSEQTKKYARQLCKAFNWTESYYRKKLASLRKYLDVVEVKMSAKEWGQINYETVPSKANLIYGRAFERNDAERRFEYLSNLKKGAAKINGGVLQPHEIVNQYCESGWYAVKEYDETLEQLWKALPKMSMSNILVVRDGSGSMGSTISGRTTCLDVATALSIYMAEQNTGMWHDKFVTFSANPAIIDMSACESLRDKIELAMNEDDYLNTDIYKTMMLILNSAIRGHVPAEEMPEMIVICSDMQFDGKDFNLNKTLFEEIIEEYEESGYKMPRICFWNINDRGENTFPLQENDMGLILCSGFSVQIMKMFMSHELDPYKVMLEMLNSPRYDAVENAVKDLIRKE